MNLNVYNEKQEMIFDEIRSKRIPGEVYVMDGIVNPQIWFKQKVRPLFLLKEAHGGNDDWSLLEQLMPIERKNEKTCGSTWRKVTQWTYGLLGTDTASIPKFDESKIPELKYGNEMLKRIAVVNVKKTAGKSNSDMNEINEFAKRDRVELKQQIELYDPTVIICGYTMSSLNIIMIGNEKNGIKDYSCPNQNWFYTFKLNGHDVIAIDYYHPSNQFPDLLNYYALMHIYQLALKGE